MNFDYNSIEYRYKENIESLVDLYDKYLTERNINSSDSIKNVFVLDFHYRLQSILLLIQSFNENEEQVKILISYIK